MRNVLARGIFPANMLCTHCHIFDTLKHIIAAHTICCSIYRYGKWKFVYVFAEAHTSPALQIKGRAEHLNYKVGLKNLYHHGFLHPILRLKK